MTKNIFILFGFVLLTSCGIQRKAISPIVKPICTTEVNFSQDSIIKVQDGKELPADTLRLGLKVSFISPQPINPKYFQKVDSIVDESEKAYKGFLKFERHELVDEYIVPFDFTIDDMHFDETGKFERKVTDGRIEPGMLNWIIVPPGSICKGYTMPYLYGKEDLGFCVITDWRMFEYFYDYTFIHEQGHWFSLPHTLDKSGLPSIRNGLDLDYMTYTWIRDRFTLDQLTQIILFIISDRSDCIL